MVLAGGGWTELGVFGHLPVPGGEGAGEGVKFGGD